MLVGLLQFDNVCNALVVDVGSFGDVMKSSTRCSGGVTSELPTFVCGEKVLDDECGNVRRLVQIS